MLVPSQSHDTAVESGTAARGGAGLGRWGRRLTGALAAAVVLAGFWVFMLSGVRDKSMTSDEPVHAVAGYTYWKFNDYRLNPENGVLPQRVAGLPLVLSGYAPPPRDAEAWRCSDEWAVGEHWFHRMGHDVEDMLRRGRAAIGVLTVVLGALVWHWARRLFGPVAGMLSLLLFVASPIVLANGALITSDATCSLFFLASIFALWAVLHRLTWPRLLVSGLVVGGLFVSKMSAVLIIPIGLTLMIGRVVAGPPLWVGFGLNRELAGRGRRVLACAAIAAVHVVVVPAVIWAAYGFRFASFASATEKDRFQHPWDFVLEKPEPLSLLHQLNLTAEQQVRANEVLAGYDWHHEGVAAARAVGRSVLTEPQRLRLEALLDAPPPRFAAKAFAFVHRRQLLPEAYVYGYAHAWRFARKRSAFFNGEYGVSGWKTFFPYTFLVKTPLPVFGIMALAAAAAVAKWRRAARDDGIPWLRSAARGFYATLPLWALLAFYWAAVIPSRLNIGHRHIMATYAPLFVLCGCAAWWVEAWLRRPATGPRGGSLGWVLALGGLAAALVADVAYRYPHYIAYFNGIVSPAQAYRHLVDSSLDWGQDLPGVKRYLETKRPDGPVYFSYFGTASPAYYGITAKFLYSPMGLDGPRTPVRELRTNERELETDLAGARSAWPDCEPVVRNDGPDGAMTVYFLQHPVLPRLTGGTYLISATMLPAIWFNYDGPLGSWNARFEARYQELYRTIRPLLNSDARARAEAFARRPPAEWTETFEAFAQFRFARLTAFLRQRDNDDHIGYSILVYQLTDAEVERALDGPPPELGKDVPALLAAQGET